MPARSRAQQAAMAIAEHAPGKLQPQNRGLLNMSQPQLHDFAATPTSGLPRYVGKYAAGGDVAPPPPSLYGQGGEVDVSLPSQPQMPNTPSMEQNRTVGYAKGGPVKGKAPAKFAKGGVVGGTDPQTEAAKPPLRGRIKPKLSRAQRVAKFEQDNGDEEV